MRAGKGDPRFVGNWRLVSFVNIDEKGVSTPNPFTGGRIMYDAAGQMAAQFTHANRAALPANPVRRPARRGLRPATWPTTAPTRSTPPRRKVTHHVEGVDQPELAEDRPRPLFRVRRRRRHLRLSIRDAAGRTTGTLTWARIR